MHGGRICTGATLQLLAIINACMVRIIDENNTLLMHQNKIAGPSRATAGTQNILPLGICINQEMLSIMLGQLPSRMSVKGMYDLGCRRLSELGINKLVLEQTLL